MNLRPLSIPAIRSMKEQPVDDLETRVAKALYDARPFVIASTATTFGHQVAKTCEWDGAPAYYQEDMRQLAQAAIAAVREWDKEQASDLLKSIRMIARSALSGSVPPYDALERIEDTIMEAIGPIPPSIPNPQVHN